MHKLMFLRMTMSWFDLTSEGMSWPAEMGQIVHVAEITWSFPTMKRSRRQSQLQEFRSAKFPVFHSRRLVLTSGTVVEPETTVPASPSALVDAGMAVEDMLPSTVTANSGEMQFMGRPPPEEATVEVNSTLLDDLEEDLQQADAHMDIEALQVIPLIEVDVQGEAEWSVESRQESRNLPFPAPSESSGDADDFEVRSQSKTETVDAMS